MTKPLMDGINKIPVPKVSKTYECPDCESTQSVIELCGFDVCIPILICNNCKYTGHSFDFEGVWVN